VTGLVPVAVGVVLYLLLTRAFRIAEADVLWRMVRDRLRPAR
jgi:hypothetical protein